MSGEQEELKIEEVFESAVAIVQSLPKEGPIQPSNDLKLKLYSYYKQATCGPNDTPKPYIWQAVEYYKWNAWLKLGDMSREDAMTSYIMELKKIMETIPRDQTGHDEGEHFKEVLGKKFYDYCKFIVSPQTDNEARSELDGECPSNLLILNKETNQTATLQTTSTDATGFNQWEQKSSGQELTASQVMAGQPATSQQVQATAETTTRGNDTQSNSSGGSSMSMLEEAQAADADGYKTPNSFEQCNITGGQMSDQFALSLLRLQHGLDQTVGRLNRLEEMVKQSLDGVRLLQSQTEPKQRFLGANQAESGLCGPSGGRKSGPVSGCRRKFINFVRSMGILHWFYLSYPIVVYLILRALERRRRNNQPLW